MKIQITADLLEKEVLINGETKQVYGLASLHTTPRLKGLGRMIMKWSEEKAKEDGKFCVVGFATEYTFENFDKKCGWLGHGLFEDRVIMTSIPVDSIVVTEKW